MHDIGIVGAGIGGLHLGLYLLQHGIKPTLYIDRSPDQMRSSRLPNTVALFDTTLSQMKQLGVSHWDMSDTVVREFEFGIKGMPQFHFLTPANPPFQFIDMRLYLPRILEDFIERGGRVVSTPKVDVTNIEALADAHDLVIVASGRGSLSGLFPTVTERSPFREPQRRVLGGLFTGIEHARPLRFTQQVVPEHGEVAEFPLRSFDGMVNGILVLAVPGGALEPMTHLRYEDDPPAFDRAMLELLREHSPSVFDRIEDPSRFAALGPLDVVQGAVLPVVRHGMVELRPGRYALALGDAHVSTDPIIAQGANAAARAAWLLGEILTARVEQGGAFDAELCTQAEARLWQMLQPVSEWSNAALQPPKPHAMELIAAATSNASLAEQFVANFDDPARQWEVLSRPENTTAFIQAHASAPQAPPT